MPLVCPRCGAYALTNEARSPDSTQCGECGQSVPANIFPLFIVTGASGSGKTALVPELRRRLPECVVFDKDLLWGRCGDEHFTNNWLRIAYSVAQGGRHAVICGTVMPWDVDACEDRGLVGAVHYLGLHCGDEVRERRLRERPAWRGADDAFIEEHRKFAAWLLENASVRYDPPLVTVDTSDAPVAQTADAVSDWVLRTLGGRCTREIAAESSSA